MIPRKKPGNQSSLFFSFSDTLNQKHPLFILADSIKWGEFETAFNPLYCSDNGGPRQAHPIASRIAYVKAYSQCFR